MPGTPVKFFTPIDPLAINTLLSLTGAAQWIIQTGAPNKSKDRAVGLAANGDENAWKAHNLKNTDTLVYECHALSGSLALPIVGTVTATTLWHIDSVKVDYNSTGWPKMTVVVHKHGTGTATHAAASCNKFTPAIVLPACFGVPAELVDKTPETPVTMFELTVASIGMKSLSYGLSCTHVDETGPAGDWLAGENRDGAETLDVEMTGSPTDAEITVDASFHDATDGGANGNTSSDNRKLSLIRHIARDAA